MVDELNDIILSTDGHYVAAGRSADYGSEPERPWTQSLLLKTDDKGIYLKEGVSSIEVDAQLDIKVYPNPVSSPLYISQKGDKPLRATIIDVQGRKLEGFSLDNATHTHILDTSSYVAGTYFLRLQDAEGLQVTKTFVVGK